MWGMRSSVANRVYAAFGAIVALMACLMAIAIIGMHSARSSLDQYSHASGRATAAGQVLDSLDAARLAFAQYDRNRDEETVAVVQAALETVDSSLAEGRLGAEESALFIQFAERTADILARDATARTARAEMNRLGSAATATLAGLIEQTSQSANLNARAAAVSGLAMQHILSARLEAAELDNGNESAAIGAAAEAAQAGLATLADLHAIFFRAEDLAQVEQTVTATQSYLAQLDIVGETLAARNLAREDHARIDETLVAAYDAVVADAAATQLRADADARALAETTQWTTLIVGGLLVIVSSALAVAMARWISRSVRRTAEMMEEIAGGNLESEIETVSRATEFRQMTGALTVFRDNGLAMRAMDRQSAEVRRNEAETDRLRRALQADIGRVVTAASDGDFPHGSAGGSTMASSIRWPGRSMR